jgi:hypothetical protein
MPGASHRSFVVIEILVESAALYSVSMLVWIFVFELASDAFFNTYIDYSVLFVVNATVSIQSSVLQKTPCLLIGGFHRVLRRL